MGNPSEVYGAFLVGNSSMEPLCFMGVLVMIVLDEIFIYIYISLVIVELYGIIIFHL